MFFSKQVDRRSRKSMVAFLTDHFRYDTMSSWNKCTSFAHNIKIHSLGLPSNLVDAAYDLVFEEDREWSFDNIIDEFTDKHNGAYTIGTNGRSSGYLVLYKSSYKASDYKSRCRSCAQLNYVAVTDGESNKCGRCGASGNMGRHNFTTPLIELQVSPGQSIDQYEEYDAEEWSMESLRRRVDLVRSFDEACDQIRQSFIDELEERIPQPVMGNTSPNQGTGSPSANA